VTKSQVDKIGERLRAGDTSDEVRIQLEEYRSGFRVVDSAAVSLIGSLGFRRLDLSRRVGKSTPSIIAKLQRERTLRLSQMQDIAGCRIIVDYLSEQNELIRRLTRKAAESTVDDRRQKPSHGYRAVHVILSLDDLPYEVQVRTEAQDLWAQLVEKLSDSAYPKLKYGEGPPELIAELMSLSERELEFDTAKDELAHLERASSGVRRSAGYLVTPGMVGRKQRKTDQLARELDTRFEGLGGL
jgi:putative GTP pyrophosphokinase